MSRPLSSDHLDLVLAETGMLWEEMRQQRIFITGGSGFFGRWLLESFILIEADVCKEVPKLR